MLEHGGGLRAAAEQYRIPLNDWLDLSTGINPQAWLVPTLPATVWQRLPEADDGLEAVAADIRRRGVDRVANLGDNVSDPLWPQETAQYLMASC